MYGFEQIDYVTTIKVHPPEGKLSIFDDNKKDVI